MGLRNFSLTYPQLMSQALEQGIDSQDAQRLYAAYEFAEWEFNGFYRGQGMPFLCHLIRTASIVLAERQPIHVVVAALLHSAYMRSVFPGTIKENNFIQRRREIQKIVGKDAEILIWLYKTIPWSSKDALNMHINQFNTYDGMKKQLLVIRLANQLEDYLDLGMAYRGNAYHEEKIVSYGKECITLATLLGYPRLAEEFDKAFEDHRKSQLPKNILRFRGGAYKLPNFPWLYRGKIGKFRHRIKKWLKPAFARSSCARNGQRDEQISI